MKNLMLCSISPDVFKANAQADKNGGDRNRANLIASGRLLMQEFGVHALTGKYLKLNQMSYSELNEKFSQQRVLFAARRADEEIGREPLTEYDDFRRNSQRYMRNGTFLRALQGFDEDVLYPILPRTYSDAVEQFADVTFVGFGETKVITVGSNDIPFFMDSSWGASRNVPANTLYDATYTLNPQPKTAKMMVKWVQFIGNGLDFGRYYTSIAAGMYAKTMAMWNATLVAASENTALVPTNLSITYSSTNFVQLANTLSALTATPVNGMVAFGSLVALNKMLPNQVTGASNVNMDAAIATLLGPEYMRMGYIGEQAGVRYMPLMDAIVPGTQNSSPTTVLPTDMAWMMAARSYKPITIAINADTPIQLEYDPVNTADMTMGVNVTTALDMVAVVASKIGVIDL